MLATSCIKADILCLVFLSVCTYVYMHTYTCVYVSGKKKEEAEKAVQMAYFFPPVA